MSSQILKVLQKFSNPAKKKILQRFFKTGKGEYGEGDVFLGVTVPETRKVAKKFFSFSFEEIKNSLYSKFHEERLCALLILVEKFEKADEEQKEKIVNFYLAHTKQINNWDLVDLTAYKIFGRWLLDKDKKILYKLAESEIVWERRIAIISTFAFIKNNELEDTFRISKILLGDSHDLIQKAVGWMLREAGKKDKDAELGFLKQHYKKMPRTMLRYAIEKFPENERKSFLSGEV